MSLEITHPNVGLDAVCFVLGLCIGSFLNVLALRSLAETSIMWPPSQCPDCHHRLSPLDNIPVVSYVLLRGKCRYCRGGIHWQYPIVELFTGLTFLAIERIFLNVQHSPFNAPYWNGLLSMFNAALIDPLTNTPIHINGTLSLLPLGAWPAIIGCAFLACTLIAVSVTDFREKLIPHEITYPSILIGLAFSAFVRNDLGGALAGVGASYLLFDFIAFYGLKFYLWMHGGTLDGPAGRPRRLKRRLPPRTRKRLKRGLRWRLDLASIQRSDQLEEPMEVMGGGDAVLSAVMAAYLGWQLLIIALLIGFIAGMLMGMGLLIHEMMKAKLLHKCLLKSVACGAAGATIFSALGLAMQTLIGDTQSSMVPALGALGLAGGSVMGVVWVGTRVSKPYPFGPALATGGFIAMFLLPNWILISPSLH